MKESQAQEARESILGVDGVASRPRPRTMRYHSGMARSIAALSLFSLLMAGCGQPASDAPPETPDASAADSNRPAVETAAPSGPGYLGVALARQKVDVAAELDGRLSAVDVRVGDRVEPGDKIARIETRELREEIAVAGAALEALEAEERQAAIELQTIRERYQRRQALEGVFSQEEVASLLADQEQAEAALETARARVGRDRAYLEQLRSRLSYSVVTSPIAGLVAVRYLDPGAVVRSGAPVVRLLAADAFVVRFAVPPEEIGAFRAGSKIDFHIDNMGLRLTGVVSDISPQIDLASEMVFVEADLALPEDQAVHLQSGLVGSVTLPPSELASTTTASAASR
ncbi:MAG: efflux RND transporter periplasmic adaptor subunit [bacterium]|nr:efflux RND transporter periplasmic adaptor subunit [bacterium]